MNATVKAVLSARPSRLKSKCVFPGRTGLTPIDASNYYMRVFQPAVERAGIVDLHWNDLRHTFASRLVMAGIDLRSVQELMGHKTITMTLRYAHLSPMHLQDTVERLDSRPTDPTTDPGTDSSVEPAGDQSKVVDLRKENGGPCRSRTYDPLIKSQLLYQLS